MQTDVWVHVKLERVLFNPHTQTLPASGGRKPAPPKSPEMSAVRS